MNKIKSIFLTGAITAWLIPLAVSAFPNSGDKFMSGRSIYGVPAYSDRASIVVDVTKRDFVNVRCGDVVSFVQGNQTFAWKFDVASHGAVDLSKIAPANFAASNFKVYVARNSMERGG